MSRKSSVESVGPWIWKRGDDEYHFESLGEFWSNAIRKEKEGQSGYVVNYFTNMWGNATSGRDLNARIPLFFGPQIEKRSAQGVTGRADQSKKVEVRNLEDFAFALRRRVVQNSLSKFDRFSHQEIMAKQDVTFLVEVGTTHHESRVSDENFDLKADFLEDLRVSVNEMKLAGSESIQRRLSPSSTALATPRTVSGDKKVSSTPYSSKDSSQKAAQVILISCEEHLVRTIENGGVYINAWVRHYSMFGKP
jgi:hypothetical protein